MFGHNDKPGNQDDSQIDDNQLDDLVQDAQQTEPAEHDQPDETVAPELPEEHAPEEHSEEKPWQHPGQPLGQSEPPTSSQPASHHHDEEESGASGDLLAIKQKALGQLSPLVSHLDQSPEEKFKTLMMLIQSSDNQELIPQAYEAAQAIEDEKVRAQALLDVVNEINYFTHQNPEN